MDWQVCFLDRGGPSLMTLVDGGTREPRLVVTSFWFVAQAQFLAMDPFDWSVPRS